MLPILCSYLTYKIFSTLCSYLTSSILLFSSSLFFFPDLPNFHSHNSSHSPLYTCFHCPFLTFLTSFFFLSPLFFAHSYSCTTGNGSHFAMTTDNDLILMFITDVCVCVCVIGYCLCMYISVRTYIHVYICVTYVYLCIYIYIN